MGAAYQSVATDVRADIERIRKEADDISESARQSVDAAINSAIGEVIKNNDAAKRAIETALKKVVQDWDSKGP